MFPGVTWKDHAAPNSWKEVNSFTIYEIKLFMPEIWKSCKTLLFGHSYDVCA